MTDRRLIPPAGGWKKHLGWAVPSLVCLVIYWDGLWSWFLADDFVWLGLRLEVHDWRSLMSALFRPAGHGTFRPFSERGFFLLFHELFGLDAFPFHLWVMLTYFATLALLVTVMRRITGSQVAGIFAALFWAVHPALMTVMTWSSSYMHVLCGFFLLLALYLLLRHIETGLWRYYWMQLGVFLAGFGVMESNLVYPFLAAGYAWVRARRYFERTLPLFMPSLVFVVFHMSIAPKQQQGGVYSLYLDSSMLATLWTYWKWALFPIQAPALLGMPAWSVMAGVVLLSVALCAFLAWEAARRRLLGAYLLGWFLVLIGPVLPLREHLQYYYLTLPLMGLVSFAGYAAARGWQAGGLLRAGVVVLAGLYLAISAPVSRKATSLYKPVTWDVERMVRAVGAAAQARPGATILLAGVDDEMFWQAIWDRPFRLVGAEQVYLVPESKIAIGARPGTDPYTQYVLAEVPKGEDLDNVVVLAANRGMQDVTTAWVRTALSGAAARPPAFIDVVDPLAQSWLGSGWHDVEGDRRWMSPRGALAIGGPDSAGASLLVTAHCVPAQVRRAPVTLRISVDGRALAPVQARDCEDTLEYRWALPEEAAGKAALELRLEVEPVFRSPPDIRELGLVFGSFEVR